MKIGTGMSTPSIGRIAEAAFTVAVAAVFLPKLAIGVVVVAKAEEWYEAIQEGKLRFWEELRATDLNPNADRV